MTIARAGRLRKPLRTLQATLLGALLAGICGPAPAAPSPARGTAPPRVDRRLGEEEQIQRRHEWFFSSRTAGSTSPADRARKRLAAVEQTRAAVARQRTLRAGGLEMQQNPWVEKGPSPSTFGGWAFGTVSGRVSTLDVDWAGGVLYVGTASGGLWKSTDDGTSWTQLFDTAGTMTIGTVAVDPNDSSVLWVGTGENGRSCESYFGIGLLRSGDGGQTWEARNGAGNDTLDELASFANVVVDPRDSNHLVTGGRIRQCTDGSGFSGGLYTSDDGGLTWINRLASTQIYEIAQDPSVLDTFWAATDDGVFKSTDNAVTWVLQTASGLPNTSVGRTELAIAPSDSNTVYALFDAGSNSLWRTTDGGVSWTLQTSGSNACDGQCSYNMVLRVHRTDPDTLYRGTVHVFKSVNGGANWVDLSNNWGSAQKVHQDTHVLVMHPTDVDTLYVGSDGGLWKSVNGGSSFSNLNGNLNVTQFYAIGVADDDPDVICGGAQDNSSLARTTSNTWNLQAVTGDGFVCHFNPLDSDIAYITSYPSGGYPNVWRSTSGAHGNFYDITGSGSGIISGDRVNWVTPYILDPVNPDTLYLGTHRVYRSDNKGSTWTQMGPDLTGGSGSLVVVEVNRGFPSTVFSGSASGKIWRSVDGAANWTDISAGLPGRWINDIAGDPGDSDRAFAVVGGFNTDHLWEWTAGGGWTSHPGLPNVPANTVLMLSSSDIMVGTDTGVFRSFDGGQSFTPWMDSLPLGVVVTDLKYNATQNVVTAGTYGRGAWQNTLGDVSPILLYDSADPPVEVDGNGDGFIDPGETWGVSFTLRNGGGAHALGVQATLSTSAGGITLLDPSPLSFGNINASTTGTSPLTEFTVDPEAACGETIDFDVVDIVTTTPPVDFGDKPGAFSLAVGTNGPPIPSSQLDEDFEAGTPDWAHEPVAATPSGCPTTPGKDEWQLASKDVPHGTSYHCGKGPGGAYARRDYSWLYHAGKDSTNGVGVTIPADAIAATLTLEHWYDIDAGGDGGVVLIDAIEDDLDVYTPLAPVGGYPGGTLAFGTCNALEGMQAFQGSSGGWVTSDFDLLQFKGQTVYLAFVFGSDAVATLDEGWYIDNVTIQSQSAGPPICDVVQWPGEVPPTVLFEETAPGTIQATWSDACNVGTLPTQAYSVQAGDLDLLHSSGVYTHSPAGGQCGLASGATFATGPGNEYYLVIPNEGGRDGGGGHDSSGAPRPGASTQCGEQRVAVCP